jgi:hypothetical protein
MGQLVCRYGAARFHRENHGAGMFTEVGRCTLTPPDPQLKGAWVQPLHLSSEKPVSKFAFQNATCTATARWRMRGRRGRAATATWARAARATWCGLYKLVENPVDP